jgi:hypothetical protein
MLIDAGFCRYKHWRWRPIQKGIGLYVNIDFFDTIAFN